MDPEVGKVNGASQREFYVLSEKDRKDLAWMGSEICDVANAPIAHQRLELVHLAGMKDLHTDASKGIPVGSSVQNRYLTTPQTSLVLPMVACITLVLRRVKSRTESYVRIFSSTRLRTDKSQVAVGHPSRALIIAEHLDKTPLLFKLTSERGFVTITGRYRGIPVSIVSTGMGFPNTDFFVREVRECLTGDMLVVRLGELVYSDV
jgi:hypothetical protein